MKAGKEYELLVDKLYRELEPNAVVTFDDKIYDHRAQTDRQIDVSIKYKFAGVEHLIIIQAKDHKRKADVAVVDQFLTVIKDTNAGKGILISASGFTKSAISKAKSYALECLSIHSALNKKWETVLKIPVSKVIHEFEMYSDAWLNIEHKAGQKVVNNGMLFSYDGVNVIYISDVIKNEIIKKHKWTDIQKGKEIRVDLKKIKLFQAFDNEMLPIEEGFIAIKYKKSQFAKFLIEPSNYLYESNHVKSTSNLHSLEITEKTLDDIIDNKYINDPTLNDEPVITSTVLNFNNSIFTSDFKFNVKGGISGNFITKNNLILKNDSFGNSIMELEKSLKKPFN